MEGCTAPTYSSKSLHQAIVEIFARMVLICVTRPLKTGLTMSLTGRKAGWQKDATVRGGSTGNLGAKTTMKYPSVYLDGGRSGTMLSIAFGNAGQHQRYRCQDDPQCPSTSLPIVLNHTRRWRKGRLPWTSDFQQKL